jgi:hypothetical protein
MPTYEITKAQGGSSNFEDRGVLGAFKYGANIDIYRTRDSITCGQALMDIGNIVQSISRSVSPSASFSPSASPSQSISASQSPSASISPSPGSPSSSLSPSASRSPSASVSISASISPSHSVSPSPSPAAGGKSVFQDLIHWWVKCTDGNLYGFGNTGKIYKIDQYLNVSQVYDARQRIRGAAEKPSSGGKIYLEFATNTNLHRKEIPGRADWNDVNVAGAVQGDEWPKTNLNSTDWHTMRQVDGDVLIANGNKLAMSAYDDSYTNEALDLIPGNIAKTLIERTGHVVIGTVLAADPNNGVNSAIDAESPLVQVGSNGALYFANMLDSVPITKFPGGGKTNPGGVCNEVPQTSLFTWQSTALSWIDKQVFGNMALFGVYNATAGYNGVYSYGRIDKQHLQVLNLKHKLDVTEIGAVEQFNGLLFVSYYDSTNAVTPFGVRVTDLNTKAQGLYEGLDFRVPQGKKELQVNVFKRVEVFMQPLPVGCSIEFWYRIDKNGSFIRAQTADGQTSFSAEGSKKAEFSIGETIEVFTPRLVLNPSGNNAPDVFRIRTYFD